MHYKFINRAAEDIDSFYAGIAIDLDIGCPGDDSFGSIPSLSSFYVYNEDQNDGGEFGCEDSEGYGNFPPIMGIRFFEFQQQAFSALENFIYFLTSDNPLHPGNSLPEEPIEYYQYLTGSWKDGTSLTYGGTGYNIGSTDYTSHVFSGNPNLSNEWIYEIPVYDTTGNEVISLGSTGFHNPWNNSGAGKIQPGKSLEMTIAFSCFSQTGFNHIEMIDKMIIDDLRNLNEAIYPDYSQAVLNGPYCKSYSTEKPEEQEVETSFVSGIFPNPTSGVLNIAIEDTIIEEVAIYNTSWQLLYIDKKPKNELQVIDLQGFAYGLYFLRLKLDGQTLVKKILIN